MSTEFSEVRDCFCLQARRTARRLTQIYDTALRPSGLRITQFQLLAAIGEAQPVNQQVLAGLLGTDRTTLTRNLALVERNGMIRIEPGADDRREHRVRLTAAGRDAVAAAFPLWRSAQSSVAAQRQAPAQSQAVNR